MAKIFQDQKIKAQVTRKALAARFLSYDIRLSNPMQLKKAVGLAQNLALYSGSKMVVCQRREGVIRYDFQLPSYNWQTVTRGNVSGMELGLAAGRLPVVFNDSEYHALFAGATKSGKSTAMQSLMVALATEHDPSDLDVYIVDPHGDYTDFSSVAHLAAPIVSERDGIANTIQHVYNIYKQRKAEKSRKEKPIWFFIDEAQEDDCLGSKEAGHTDEMTLVASMARAAGKFGIRLIIGSQKPTLADLPGTLDNLGAKYVGKVLKASTSAHLTGQAGLSAQELSGNGDFLSISSGDVTRFQVALATQQHFNALPRADVQPLAHVSDVIQDAPIVISQPPIVISQTSEAGRPVESMLPETLAYYMIKYVSINDAKSELGLGRTVHNRYKNFAEELKAKMEKLRRQG